MPRGPRGEKRPADVIGNAVHVMRIATRVTAGAFGFLTFTQCGDRPSGPWLYSATISALGKAGVGFIEAGVVNTAAGDGFDCIGA